MESEVGVRKLSDGIVMAFEYTLSPEISKTDHILIAYSQPFTRTDVEKSIDLLESQMKQHAQEVYFHKEVLINSLEGHPMHMLTVTGRSYEEEEGKSEFTGEIPDAHDVLYPEGGQRPKLFRKPTVFISSRVHCGETCASFFLQGIFDFLGDYSLQAAILLDKFVFKFIPLLNPDGVARGYWRNDTQGLNLNRVYADPDPVFHPTIYAVKAAILHEYAQRKLFMYVDLHGHTNKRGCFVFGNTMADPAQAVEQILFPKIMSLNCVNFDVRESVFSDDANNKKDKKGDSRAASGRATIFRETGSGDVVYCFTLEGNYATGLRINTLQARFDSQTGKKVVKEDYQVQDTSSAFYRKRKIPFYTAEIYQDVGRAFCVSLLDLIEANPMSRLLKTKQDTLPEALAKLRKDIDRDINKKSIKSLKGKGKKGKKGKKGGPSFELVLGEDQEEEKQELIDKQ